MMAEVSTNFSMTTAILVRMSGKELDEFTITDLANKTELSIGATTFISSNFKYESEFEKKFLSLIPGKTDVLVTSCAMKKINCLMEFNRIDS